MKLNNIQAPVAEHGGNSTPRILTLSVILATAAVYFIWGSTYLGIKVALQGGFDPLALAAIRFITAGVLMYGYLRWRGVPPPCTQQWRNCTILGTLFLVGGNGLVCIAEQTVSSGLAAIAFSTIPLWAAIFSGLFGQWPNHRDWIGLSIGFIGVIMLNFGTEFRANTVSAVSLIAAPLLWALGSVWSQGQQLPAAPMSTAAQMIIGGTILALLSFVNGESFPLNASVKAWMALMYLSVFGSIVAFSAYMYLLAHVRPALATSCAYVNPPIAVLLGLILLGEHISALEGIAMMVILFGVISIITQKYNN